MCRKGPTPTTGLFVCAGAGMFANRAPNKNTNSVLCMGNESQSRFVNTVPQIGGLRAVVEHVSQVRIAARAMHLGALFQQTEVGTRTDVFLRDGRPKAGPASSRVELSVRTEHGRIAADAAKKPLLMDLVIRAAECRVGSLLAGHIVLLNAELLVPFAAGTHHFLHSRRTQLMPAIVILDNGKLRIRTGHRNVVRGTGPSAHCQGGDAGQRQRRNEKDSPS